MYKIYTRLRVHVKAQSTQGTGGAVKMRERTILGRWVRLVFFGDFKTGGRDNGRLEGAKAQGGW
jgi:hypothetical protein